MLTPLLLNDLVSIAQRPYPTHVSTWRMGICTGHSRGQRDSRAGACGEAYGLWLGLRSVPESPTL